METPHIRLSDTARQSSIRPADCYFQHETAYQLYRGRETQSPGKVCGERERWLYLLGEPLFKVRENREAGRIPYKVEGATVSCSHKHLHQKHF